MTIIGKLRINTALGTLETHNDDYILRNVTAVSVRRPVLAPGAAAAIGLGGFVAVFADLLYLQESASLAGIACLSLLAGWEVGQLKLLSRDLRQSDLSGVIWGRYRALNAKRRGIIKAVAAARNEETV